MAYMRELGSGRWQVVVRRKGHKPVSDTFPTKDKANQWARAIESQMDRGMFVDRSEAERTTVADLIDRYLKEVTPTKKSAKNEAQRLLQLRKRFGAFSAASLRSTHITQYRDQRLAAGLSGGTVIKELNSLSVLLDTAIKDWDLPLTSNVAKLVRRPRQPRGRDRRLMAGEEARLLAACDRCRSAMLGGIVRLALETGMRMGELLTLSWPHIDLQNRVAHLPDTKTDESRNVPLSTRAVAVLQALPRHITNPRTFWCWNRSDSLENVWRRVVQAADLQDLKFHDLRHEAVSRLFELGLNPMEVAAISGHKTLQMLKRYTHLRASDLAKRLA